MNEYECRYFWEAHKMESRIRRDIDAIKKANSEGETFCLYKASEKRLNSLISKRCLSLDISNLNDNFGC